MPKPDSPVSDAAADALIEGLHEASEAPDILASIARIKWAQEHGGAACPPGRIPDAEALAAWLPQCPESAWAAVYETLPGRGGVGFRSSDYGNAAALASVSLVAAMGGQWRIGQGEWHGPEPEPGVMLFDWQPGEGVVGAACETLHRLWVNSKRGKHPLGPLVKAWQDAKGQPPGKASVTAARGMVRRPRPVSDVLRTHWLSAAIVDGEPLAASVLDLRRKPRRRVYRPGEQMALPGMALPAPLATDFRLATVGEIEGGSAAVPGDVLTVLALSHALDGRLELTDRQGAALLARTRKGGFRRPLPGDVKRWLEATLEADGMIFRNPKTGKWFPLVRINPLPGSTVLSAPEWMRGRRLADEGGWTLTAEGGATAKARLIAGADASPAGRIVTGLEYRLAARWDGRPGIAPDLRPARGKAGPGPARFVPWREVMALAGMTWDTTDHKADKTMLVRYGRAVKRLQRAGYVLPYPRSESGAGDAVEIVEIKRGSRAHPAGLVIRSSARFVEAARLSKRGEDKGFRRVSLVDWLDFPL